MIKSSFREFFQVFIAALIFIVRLLVPEISIMKTKMIIFCLKADILVTNGRTKMQIKHTEAE